MAEGGGNNPTQNDIDNLEQFNELLIEQKKTLAEILKLRIEGQKVEDALSETFGKQAEFLTGI